MKLLVTGGLRNGDGTFKRILPIWSPKSWDSGYVDNRGYFIVYRPDYPKAYRGGYAKRYHVVYWLQTRQILPDGFILHHVNHVKHHVNHVKTDDRFENLELKLNGVHTTEHKQTYFICVGCGESTAKDGHGNRHKYCSHQCYVEKYLRSELRRSQQTEIGRVVCKNRWGFQ